MNKKGYSANLTGAWFLYYEIKQVLILMEEGLSKEEIKEKAITENIFQHKTLSSVKRVLPSILRRAESLGDGLRKLAIHDAIINGKLINLYAIIKDDLLFAEFMDEVIKEKYHTNNLFIENKDINMYFTYKAEQSEKVAGYTTATINKLRQVYFKILVEAGILKDIKSGELNRIYFDSILREELKKENGEWFINIFE